MSLPTTFFIGRGGGGGVELASTVTFDTGGQVGPTGPTSTSLLSYSSRSDIQALNFGVTTTGIQYLDVPSAGDYNFNIRGASSVRQYYAGQTSSFWGRGAEFSGTFTISNSDQGNKLWIAVGQMPSNNVPVTTTYTGNVGSTGACFNGGGGGTFLGIGATLATAVPIIVAGGGGSQRTTYTASSSNMNARSDFANYGNPGGNQIPSGQNGNGGNALNTSDQGTAGAGFYTRGDQNFTNAGSWSNWYASSAEGFVQGARGAIAINVGSSNPQPSGGFGGGGAGGWGGSGGGGGYNGGGGGTNDPSYGNGGGGGNFYEPTRFSSVPNVVANHSGAGRLVLTYVG